MRKMILVFPLLLLLSSQVHADWAYRFVVYAGNSYIVTDEAVALDQVNKRIGKVTLYSDREGTYRGNFSNTYPKGTEYYSIVGVAVDSAIAVKAGNDNYIKAAYQGRYASIPLLNDFQFWMIMIFGTCGLIIAYFIYRTVRLK